MRTTFAKRSLRQRIVALAAACAIVLSGLMTGLATAQAAAEAINQPDSVICHGNGAAQPAPVPDENNGKICVDSCCIGCLSIAAAVPLTAAVPHSLSQRLALRTRFVLAAGTDFNAHRSRGPPLVS